jgi:hypothetical protein
VIADRMNGKGALARLVAAAAEMSADAVEYLENDPQTAGLGKAVEESGSSRAWRPRPRQAPDPARRAATGPAGPGVRRGCRAVPVAGECRA